MSKLKQAAAALVLTPALLFAGRFTVQPDYLVQCGQARHAQKCDECKGVAYQRTQEVIAAIQSNSRGRR